MTELRITKVLGVSTRKVMRSEIEGNGGEEVLGQIVVVTSKNTI